MGFIKRFKDYFSSNTEEKKEDIKLDYKEDILPFLKECFQDIKDLGYEIEFINYSFNKSNSFDSLPPKLQYVASSSICCEKDINILVILIPVEKIGYIDIVEDEFNHLVQNLKSQNLVVLDSFYSFRKLINVNHTNRIANTTIESGKLNFNNDNIFTDYVDLSKATIQITIAHKDWKKSKNPMVKADTGILKQLI